jgi:hypothetical protein
MIHRTSSTVVAQRPPGPFRRRAVLIEVRENLRDHHRVFDTGDDPERTAAGPAGLDVDAEYPFQALGPAHRCQVKQGTARAVGGGGTQRNDRFLLRRCRSGVLADGR